MTGVRVRQVTRADRSAWLEMRSALWPGNLDEHEATVRAYFTTGTPFVDMVYVAEADSGGLAGFVELRLRDYAEGSDAVGVPYVEGWFVDADVRGSGVGRALIRAAEGWARALGKGELASDAELDNERSIAAHAALGFEETGRAVTFIKRLAGGGGADDGGDSIDAPRERRGA